MSEHLHPGPHMDADQLNAFAEGVLPEHERLLCMAHLAGCPQCREVAFLAQEPVEVQLETVIAREDAPVPFWKRWLSPVPMAGAIAALACGVALFVTLHRSSAPESSQVATVTRPSSETAERRAQQAAPPPPATSAPAGMSAAPQARAVPAPSILPMPSERARKAAAPVMAGNTAPAPPKPQEAIVQPEPKAVFSADAIARADKTSSVLDAQAAGAATSAAAAPVPAKPLIAEQEVENLPISGRAVTGLARMRAGALAGAGDPLHVQIQHEALPQGGLSEASGTVTDTTGAVIPGASITLQPLAGGAKQDVKTDAAGKFAVGAIQPGHYQLQIAAQGFVPLTQQVELQARDHLTLASTLPVGAVPQTVSVTSASAMAMQPALLGEPAICLLALPGKLHASSCAQEGDTTIALDHSGTLFFRRGDNHWKKIRSVWSGKAFAVGTIPCPADRGDGKATSTNTSAQECSAAFRLRTDTDGIWLSQDGEHWHRQ